MFNVTVCRVPIGTMDLCYIQHCLFTFLHEPVLKAIALNWSTLIRSTSCVKRKIRAVREKNPIDRWNNMTCYCVYTLVMTDTTMTNKPLLQLSCFLVKPSDPIHPRMYNTFIIFNSYEIVWFSWCWFMVKVVWYAIGSQEKLS